MQEEGFQSGRAGPTRYERSSPQLYPRSTACNTYLCIHRPSPPIRQYADPHRRMPFNMLLASLGRLLGRVFRVENLVLLVSLFSLRLFVRLFCRANGGKSNTYNRPRKRGHDYRPTLGRQMRQPQRHAKSPHG
jgi:hypothetical protein